MDRYGTHLPLLLQAVGLTKGPVLEIGCGIHSTLALHEACDNRPLVSLESNSTWASRFLHLASQHHRFHVGPYDEFDSLIRRTPWSVVLVDHAPAQRRQVEAPKVTGAELVIFHDTNVLSAGTYNFRAIFKLYRRRYTDRRLSPWTTVATNSDADFLSPMFPSLDD
jgi:hypothetical protein